VKYFIMKILLITNAHISIPVSCLEIHYGGFNT
jgi:hypothetical protein